jgi:ferrochelatase
MGFARAATAGPDPRFADMVAELVAEHLHAAAPRSLGDVPGGGGTVNGAACAVDCCHPTPRGVRTS